MSTNQDHETRRTGRPALAAEDRKSAMIRFRAREELKDAIDQAAGRSGRTASEEAELRLINSFKLEPLHRVVFGHENAGEFFKSLISIVETIQGYQNPPGVQLGSPDWMNSDLTRAALRSAIANAVEYLIPPAHRPEDTPWTPSQRRQYAAALAHMEEVGADVSRAITGQAVEGIEMLNLNGAPEH